MTDLNRLDSLMKTKFSWDVDRKNSPVLPRAPAAGLSSRHILSMLRTVGSPLYLDILRRSFEERREKNPRLSMRAFARQLGIDHGVLSQILAGKRIPSKGNCKSFSDRFQFNAMTLDAFMQSVEEARRELKLRKASSGSNKAAKGFVTVELSPEQLAEISHWYHSAIMELTLVEGFDSRSEWIADKLKIPEKVTRKAVNSLLQCGLLTNDRGKLKKIESLLVSKDRDRTLPHLQSRQSQALEKSRQALYSVPIDKRSHSSLTMAVDPERIPEAKKMIEEFSRSLFRFLNSGRRTHVYELSVGLFPVQEDS